MPASAASTSITRLIGAVRRRLWHETITEAARTGGWAAAAALALGAATRVAYPPWADAVLIGAVVLAVLTPMAGALRRRPDAAQAALWADRHLGGASAFTTWSELQRGGQSGSPAAQRLTAWATQRVPEALRRLQAQRQPTRLARPWAAATVCAVLAVFVRALPPPTAQDPSTASASAAGSPVSAPAAAGPEPAWSSTDRGSERSRDLAAALRDGSQAMGRAARGTVNGADAPAGQQDRTEAADRTRPDRPDRPADPSAVHPTDPRAVAGRRDDPAGLVEASLPAGATGLPGAGPGREAGDSRDDRAQFGRSRAAAALAAVQRSPLRDGRPVDDRQADPTRSGTWNEPLGERAPPGSSAPTPSPPVAAATAPPAERGTALTASETSYLRTWLKTAGPRR